MVLDVCDKGSIEALRDQVKDEFGQIAVLINNANVAWGDSFEEEVDKTMAVNYSGLLDMCRTLMPALTPGARVVNITHSSFSLALSQASDQIQTGFIAATDLEQVTNMMLQYQKAVHSGLVSHDHDDWFFGNGFLTPFMTSKLGVTAATPYLQTWYDQQRPGDDIVVNAVCPDLSKQRLAAGDDPVEGGVDSVMEFVTLGPKSDTRGQFIRENKPLDWRNPDDLASLAKAFTASYGHIKRKTSVKAGGVDKSD
jgi:NAD(P)-dependent dehydrogenase (short-subunit alcohol dehydrogenase family)